MNARRLRAIQALVSQPTIAAAARSCGLSEVTLHRYIAEPAFSAAYETAKRQVLGEGLELLQKAVRQAASVLVAIALDESAPKSVRVTAAGRIIDGAMRAKELELEARVAALEAVTNAIKA